MSAISQVPSSRDRARGSRAIARAGRVMSCRQSKVVTKSKLASPGSGSRARVVEVRRSSAPARARGSPRRARARGARCRSRGSCDLRKRLRHLEQRDARAAADVGDARAALELRAPRPRCAAARTARAARGTTARSRARCRARLRARTRRRGGRARSRNASGSRSTHRDRLRQLTRTCRSRRRGASRRRARRGPRATSAKRRRRGARARPPRPAGAATRAPSARRARCARASSSLSAGPSLASARYRPSRSPRQIIAEVIAPPSAPKTCFANSLRRSGSRRAVVGGRSSEGSFAIVSRDASARAQRGERARGHGVGAARRVDAREVGALDRGEDRRDALEIVARARSAARARRRARARARGRASTGSSNSSASVGQRELALRCCARIARQSSPRAPW